MVATQGRMLTASAGAVTPMWRRDAAGELVKVERQGDEYQTPPRGTRARLQLSGISEVFEMTSQYSDAPVEKIRVEFLIEKGTGNAAKMLEGKRFTEMMTWTVGPKSTLGKLLGALRGRDVTPGEQVNPDDFIGTSFVATVAVSEDGKWGKVVPDAIEAGSVRLFAAASGAGEPIDDGAFDDDPL